MTQSVSGLVGRLTRAFAVCDAAEAGDADLLERFRSHADAAAFEAIVRRHGPMVLGACRRLLRSATDADDAFQATFAILIRRAGSLTRPERLAGWLFQVAYRTARRARAIGLRRASTHFALQDVPVEEPVADIVWRELRPIFDEEVNRLPEKLRLPVVLCFLEGQTKRAAAKSLGWPEGTFSCRLQQARELLQSRLARRGVTLSSGALAVALFEGTASAALSPALVSSTVQSLSLIAEGSALSAPVAALTQGVLQSMVITKLKIAAAIVVAVGVLGGGSGWMLQYGGGDSTGSAWAADQPKKPVAQSTNPAPATDGTDSAKIKELLDRREQLLAQQREIDDQIAILKLEAIRLANQKKPDNVREPFLVISGDDPREIERLKKIIADLQAQNEDLRNREVDQRLRAEGQRDQAVAQEMLAKQSAELAAAEAQLKLKESQVNRFKDLAKQNAIDKALLEEKLAELEHARAVVEKLKTLLKPRASDVRFLNEKLITSDVRVAEAEVKQSEAALAAGEAKLQMQQNDLVRAQKLIELKAIAQEEYDKIRASVELARAEVAQGRATLQRAQAILQLAKQQSELKAAQGKDKAWPDDPELEKVMKLLAAGVVSEADADKVRIALATARIRAELGTLVALREREVVRAKQLLDARKINADEFKKSMDALEALKRWQAQWK
jgi:RNA polymerase sigma factor (sigma-70 family)